MINWLLLLGAPIDNGATPHLAEFMRLRQRAETRCVLETDSYRPVAQHVRMPLQSALRPVSLGLLVVDGLRDP